jgi:hypothetical protein
MGQAELEIQNDPLTIDGLGEFFDTSETVTQPLRDGDAAPPRGLTFKEACTFFGLKPTALRVRIKSGEISAEKIEGVNGPEWRIYPAQPSRNPSAHIAQPLRGPEANKLLEIIQELQTKLDTANHQLQASSYRNGYLESQLQEREREVKLLTDERQRGGRWERLKRWFSGRDGTV